MHRRPPELPLALAGPGSAERPSRRVTLFCLALAVVPYFLALGVPALWDSNEPLYAEPPQEVLRSGEFWAPTCNGVLYTAHPPLATWITLPFYALLGPSPFSHRLPMALASVLTILATFSIGRQLGGRQRGLLAALVLAASPKFWLISRQLGGDVYLVTCLTGAVALLLPRLLGSPRLGRFLLGHALLGLAFLAKGPVVLVLYGGGMLGAFVLARPRPTLRSLCPLRALAIMLLVGTPWFLGMALAGTGFDADFFGRYTVDRFLGDLGVRSVTFYLVVLLGDAQPWILLLPLGVWRFWRGDRRMGRLLPGTLALWTLVFFSLSAGKRNVYLLPVYPLLAVLVAPVLEDAMRGLRTGWTRAAGAVLGLAALLGAACLWMMQAHEPRIAPEVYLPMGVLVAGAGALWIVSARGRGRFVGLLAIGTVLVLEAATALSFDALDRFRPVPGLAERIEALESGRAVPRPIITFASPVHSLRFYLGRPTRVARDGAELRAHLGPRTDAFVLVYEHRVERLRRAVPELRLEELARGPELRFRFENTVFGRHKTTRDLILFRVRGHARGAPDRQAPIGGCE